MSVTARLAAVRERIAAACDASQRDPATVTLVAVSKRHPVDAIREAIDAGQEIFGENYAQELVDKALAVEARWHFIGHLQRNKVRHLVPSRAVIETVDSSRLLEELDRRAEQLIEIFIQVNVAAEPGKFGCPVDDLPSLVERARALPSLRLRGLMLIPPAGEDPRPHFAALRRLAQAHGLSELSMGMSADLETAVEEGATHVRVGTAIFGPRPAR